MNAFSPQTFSTDWEIAILKRDLTIASNSVIAGLSGQLAVETGLPVHMDDDSVEFGLGVNRSLDQIWRRIVDATDRAASLAASLECDLFPAATSPVMSFYNAAHVHVGTLHDEAVGVRLERALMRYTPVFAALGANSPLANYQARRYKSHRVRVNANGCTQATEPRTPSMSQFAWGGDASPKVWGAPTLEVRIIDCASSRRLLAELATFIAAFVHHLGASEIDDAIDERAYQEYVDNRWLACRYGMQATFSWNGRPRQVGDIVAEMLAECAPSLADLDTRPTDLGVIGKMAEKRLCQADLALDIASRYEDPICLMSAYAKRLRNWSAFEEFLDTSPALEPAEPLSRPEVLDEHFRAIGEGTSYYVSRSAMSYPPPQADAVLDELLADGRIVREITADGAIIVSRTPSI